MSEPLKLIQPDNTSCMRTCIACYFRCTLMDAPDLYSDSWVEDVTSWAHGRGFGHICVPVIDQAQFKKHFGAGFLIVSGRTIRQTDHAVIYKNGELWHDPHPDQLGILSVEYASYFYPLEPP